jgi:peptide deformylase
MYRGTNGVGLAAPQVGWNVRLFVMNPDQRTFRPQEQRVFWNPAIVERLGERRWKREGCLSLPRVFGDIERWDVVRLKAMTPAGPIDEFFSEFAGEIVQHEVDHLDGKLCYDQWRAAPARSTT